MNLQNIIDDEKRPARHRALASKLLDAIEAKVAGIEGDDLDKKAVRLLAEDKALQVFLGQFPPESKPKPIEVPIVPSEPEPESSEFLGITE